MTAYDDLIPPHGGFRNLLCFEIARLCYDLTVRFCDRYIEKRSRTHDQMVQAARSGTQNIAEASLASGTSKSFEIKLTKVAVASLGELLLDYEDFLRHRRLEQWHSGDARRKIIVTKRFKTVDQIGKWILEEFACGNVGSRRMDGTLKGKDEFVSEYAANVAIVLILVATKLLNKLVQKQTEQFVEKGGLRERMYKFRTVRREEQLKDATQKRRQNETKQGPSADDEAKPKK